MEQKVEYVYHWNRIIGAAAVVLALLGMLALGMNRWRSPAPETAELSEETDIEVVEVQPTAPDTGQPDQAPAVISPVEPAVVESPTSTAVTAAIPSVNDDADTAEPALKVESASIEQPPALATPVVEDQQPALPVAPESLTQTEPEAIDETPPTPVADAAEPSGALVGTASTTSAMPEPSETPVAPHELTDLSPLEPTILPPTASGPDAISKQPKTALTEPAEEAAPTAIEQALLPSTASDTTVVKKLPQTPVESAAEPSVKVVEQSPPPAETIAKRNIAKLPETPAATTTEPSVSVKEIEAGLLPSTAGGTDTVAEPAPVDTNKGPFRLINIATQAAPVKRFVLAKSVVNLEPKGAIDDISFDKRGMAAVYCFSEVAGREHPTLEYIWRRNDQVVARVNVGVKGKRWRSYSSKLINRRMKGDWQVELRGKDNELLASAEFTL